MKTLAGQRHTKQPDVEITATNRQTRMSAHAFIHTSLVSYIVDQLAVLAVLARERFFQLHHRCIDCDSTVTLEHGDNFVEHLRGTS